MKINENFQFRYAYRLHIHTPNTHSVTCFEISMHKYFRVQTSYFIITSFIQARSRMQGEESLRRVISLLVCVTVELHNRLRTMFLPTAQRCHYIFTARDLSNIFR